MFRKKKYSLEESLQQRAAHKALASTAEANYNHWLKRYEEAMKRLNDAAAQGVSPDRGLITHLAHADRKKKELWKEHCHLTNMHYEWDKRVQRAGGTRETKDYYL